MSTTVIHHSADYDGIFCREIARKFLPEATFIGWDFKDKPLPIPEGRIYLLDLPVDRVFGFNYKLDANLQHILSYIKGETPNDVDVLDYAVGEQARIIWIDHHKSSIETHPTDIPGYRIDGVSACRLAWQWFAIFHADGAVRHPQGFVTLPPKQAYLDRLTLEPIAVRLAGEYDIWDHRDDQADVAFQFGLDCQAKIPWDQMLRVGWGSEELTEAIVAEGRAAMRCYAKRDADIMRERSFVAEFEGLKFLCLNTARCNSQTFAARDVPETGHDALLAFYCSGDQWNISLYHAKHRTDLDLSNIAVNYGGGGHRGACGFRLPERVRLPFLSTLSQLTK